MSLVSKAQLHPPSTHHLGETRSSDVLIQTFFSPRPRTTASGEIYQSSVAILMNKSALPDMATLHSTIHLPLFSRSKHIFLQKAGKERASYIFSLLGNKCQRLLSVIFRAPSFSYICLAVFSLFTFIYLHTFKRKA